MTQSINDVRGIGPAMQVALAKNGFKTIAGLANTTVEQLIVVRGFSTLKAAQVINDARNLLASDITNVKITNVKPKASKDKKKSKKAKPKNKDKDKDKDKQDKKKKNKKAKDETKDTKKSKKSKKSKNK